MPDRFEWEDPSKTQNSEIFRLLNHWRVHQDNGSDPLIWAPTCLLFKDAVNVANHVWTIQQARDLQHVDSDEELFVLPSTDNVDEEDESHGGDDTSEPSSQLHNDATDKRSTSPESVILDAHMNHPNDRLTG